MGNIGFEKNNQRMSDHVKTLQKINMSCEKILSDMKDDLICFMMNTVYFYPPPRTEPGVKAVMT